MIDLNTPIMFREAPVQKNGKLKYLQYRVDYRKNANPFKKYFEKFFYRWHYAFYPVCDPTAFNTVDQDLSYDLARCGHKNMPRFSWIQKHVKTYGQFYHVLDRLSTENIKKK